jgi:hypothetical protein
MKIENVKITDFAKRHFDSKFGGTKILDFTPEDFERILITNINTLNLIPTTEYSTERILPGYADFCKLVVVKNFTNARTGTLPITLDNYQYLRTGFSSRTEKELPVMDRWFDLPLPAPKAEYLVVVLYSKEQLDKERKEGEEEFDGDWGAVAILGQMSAEEEVMKPITMMRNALGIEEGGSGVPIDREAYKKSVDFWSKNATVK